MKKLLAALGLSAVLTASAALPLASVSEAALSYGGAGADVAHQVAPVEKAQFLYGGYNYCWYPGGWRGPGYYWCGYAWRTGLGWGGPFGWHGWRGGGAWRLARWLARRRRAWRRLAWRWRRLASLTPRPSAETATA